MSKQRYCPNCGAPIDSNRYLCPDCQAMGEHLDLEDSVKYLLEILDSMSADTDPSMSDAIKDVRRALTKRGA